MALGKTYDKDFEYFFWAVYPKKVGKAASEKQFLKLRFSEDQMRELREHIEKRKRRDKKWMPNKDGVTFVVDPERFLKYRRFEDEYEMVSVHAAHDKIAETKAVDERPVWQKKNFASEAAYREAVDRSFLEAKRKGMGLH